jgi:hypothetical protein
MAGKSERVFEGTGVERRLGKRVLEKAIMTVAEGQKPTIP